MKRALLLLVVAACFLPACEEEEPPPPPPPPAAPTAPPEPSPEQIYNEISPVLDIIRSPVDGRGPFGGETKQNVFNEIRNAKTKHGSKDNGKIALSRLSRGIEDIIKEARDAGYWKLVLSACEAYEILEPGTLRTRRYIDEAKLQLARPKVEIKGFVEDKENNDTYVFLEINLRDIEQIEQVQVREGEEFLDPPHTLRFIEILGNNKGVKLEYLAIEGDTFDVMTNE